MIGNPHAVPGAQFSWEVSGVIFRTKPSSPDALWTTSASEVSRRGQTVTITEDLLTANPWLAEVLGNDEEQVRRWGRVRVRAGEWPSSVPSWTPGSREEGDAFDAERRAAWAQPVGPLRDAALLAFRERWGNGLTTNRTIQTVTGDGPRTDLQPRAERVRF